MSLEIKIEGITHDWQSYNKAIKERWEKQEHNITKCKLHNTFFETTGEHEEPCWMCWDEFEVKL